MSADRLVPQRQGYQWGSLLSSDCTIHLVSEDPGCHCLFQSHRGHCSESIGHQHPLTSLPTPHLGSLSRACHSGCCPGPLLCQFLSIPRFGRSSFAGPFCRCLCRGDSGYWNAKRAAGKDLGSLVYFTSSVIISVPHYHSPTVANMPDPVGNHPAVSRSFLDWVSITPLGEELWAKAALLNLPPKQFSLPLPAGSSVTEPRMTDRLEQLCLACHWVTQ